MLFPDIALSRRLEQAEGYAAAQFVDARSRMFPTCGSEWMETSGTYAIFDGADSPITQTFGLGLFEEVSESSLDRIERFFTDRKAPVHHEVSPFAGVAALDLLCARHYSPAEISCVLYRPLGGPLDESSAAVRVRTIGPAESDLWAQTNARGWAHEHPELRDFLLQTGAILSSRQQNVSF